MVATCALENGSLIQVPSSGPVDLPAVSRLAANRRLDRSYRTRYI